MASRRTSAPVPSALSSSSTFNRRIFGWVTAFSLISYSFFERKII
jgi:hypothetical protein